MSAIYSNLQEVKAQVDLFASVQAGTFEFLESLPVSAKSLFGDSKWDFNDEKNPRLKMVNSSKLRFDWTEIACSPRGTSRGRRPRNYQKFVAVLPPRMVEDLKRAFFLALIFPEPIRPRRGEQRRKAVTVISKISVAVNFFSYCYLQSMLSNGVATLHTLSDIGLHDIQNAISDYPYRIEELKKVLSMLANERIQVNLRYGRLKWNQPDLKTLKWPRLKEKKHIKSLPDELFALLSNRSSELVAEFLGLLGTDVQDRRTVYVQTENSSPRWERFKEMFESYCERRISCRIKGGHADASTHTRLFMKEFTVFPEELFDFLSQVQCAAQNIILLYTGMRYSEAAMIQRGCLIKRDGVCLIKAALIKNIPSNRPIDLDEWVAIDVVHDAVVALETLCRCTTNSFLFSNFHTLQEGKSSRPLSNGGLSFRLNEYLREIDKENKWKRWKVTPHQYRHGLVRQLAHAEVGLPYITRQLKHFHTYLSERSYRINPVSTIYGMQKERLVCNATGFSAMKDANFDILDDLYGEGRKFGGGGAALHIERTEAFFKGIGLEGDAREKYIKKLAASGVTAIKTGVGWCIRNHVDPQKLKEAPPPCIGDLNCNPHSCVYSIVPEGRKADVIARYRHALRQLSSPDQSHLKSHWEAELRALSSMLQQLGVDPQSLTASRINPDTIVRLLSSG